MPATRSGAGGVGVGSSAAVTPVGPVALTPSTSHHLGGGEPHVGRPEPGRLIEVPCAAGGTPGEIRDRACNPQQPFGPAAAGPFQIGQLDDAPLRASIEAAGVAQSTSAQAAIERAARAPKSEPS